MRRSEALAAVVAALGCVAYGVTWLVGPFGLLGFGVALLLAALFIDVKG